MSVRANFTRATVAGLMIVALTIVHAQQEKFGRGVPPWGMSGSLPWMDCRLEPDYTPEARTAKIEGLVVIEAVVETDGSVSEARIIQSLDARYGLDEAALALARTCRGRPARANGSREAVRAIARIPFLFRLHRPGIVEGDPNSQSDRDKSFAGDAYSPDSKGVVPPEVTHSAEPKYTSQAMRNALQGDIWYDVVIGTDGRVRAVRQLTPIGDGLDKQAELAIKQWRFKSAMLGGTPVAVVVQIQMSFRLH